MLRENYYPCEDIFGTLVGGAVGIGQAAFNNWLAGESAEESRSRNYYWNEKAAENADMRTRKLYNDFYSPSAQVKQYIEAGLSPSMLYGGTPGQGGMGGAQSAGAAGPQTAYAPVSMLEGAQIANVIANTKKTEAETKSINKDTDIKNLEQEFKELNLEQYKSEWNILNTNWEDPATGQQTSLFEMADKHYTFESFLEDVRNNKDGSQFKASTEAEIKQLRNIYENASRFHRDITVLSHEEVNASFQMSIIRALKSQGFENKNAEAAIKQLQQEIDTNELTSTQKEAWNNLIDRLGKKGSTTRDIVVVLGMILGNFASHTGIKINMGS